MINSVQLSNAPYPQISGLQVISSTSKTITVNSGSCRDSTNTFDIILGTNTVIDSTYNGFGGLDTGSLVGNTCYAVYLIADSSKYENVGTLLSLSGISPYLPTGYDLYKRIGWAFTDATPNFRAIKIIGNGNEKYYQFNNPFSALTDGSSTTFNLVNLSVTVPPINTIVNFNYSFTPNAAANKVYFREPLSNANQLFDIKSSIAAVSVDGLMSLAIGLDPYPALEFRTDTGSDTISLIVLGFYDYL